MKDEAGRLPANFKMLRVLYRKNIESCENTLAYLAEMS
jgi:hypothetical protein